ncbi:MAG: hypothetical protein NVSMB44_13030 [Ktedonobacteraceae bacterium]
MKAAAKLAGYLLLPCVFFLVSPAWLERRPSLCLSQLVFRRVCPGCGMMRALSWALHGQFRKAWHYNKRIVVVLPLLGFVWLRRTIDSWRELHRAFPTLPTFPTFPTFPTSLAYKRTVK